jgi:hypothetical protein
LTTKKIQCQYGQFEKLIPLGFIKLPPVLLRRPSQRCRGRLGGAQLLPFQWPSRVTPAMKRPFQWRKNMGNIWKNGDKKSDKNEGFSNKPMFPFPGANSQNHSNINIYIYT